MIRVFEKIKKNETFACDKDAFAKIAIVRVQLASNRVTKIITSKRVSFTDHIANLGKFENTATRNFLKYIFRRNTWTLHWNQYHEHVWIGILDHSLTLWSYKTTQQKAVKPNGLKIKSQCIFVFSNTISFLCFNSKSEVQWMIGWDIFWKIVPLRLNRTKTSQSFWKTFYEYFIVKREIICCW